MSDRPTRPESEQEIHASQATGRDRVLELLQSLVYRQSVSAHPSPARQPAENVPPRPFGLFSNLFGVRSAPRSSGDAQSVQDRDAAAEMLLTLAHTLQTHEEHSPAILQHALVSLGKVGNAAEHLALVVPFLDTRWEQGVRLAAVSAAGNLGGEAAVDALISLLNDPDIVVRWEVQAVLDRLLTTSTSETPFQAAQATSAESAADETTTELPF
ncbi:MAG: HEAT repeat domain-containing protein [Anaerolineae bacterium]|nr:HEAT repeat domain-containing protein [Anaerolineae bacterium]MDW8299489.1 HEAT repeat domain-containing protein [Anaerolineae bacterium]